MMDPTPLPRLPHYAQRAAERYGYQPAPQLVRWFVDAIEGNGQAPAEIGATLIQELENGREIWDVLVCGSPQRVVFCPLTRTIITFLPPGPKPPKKLKRGPTLSQWYGRASAKRNRKPRAADESEELA